ncbi:MAG: ankyrin repeat domain-containing protein [Armatimonadota bacterium]
MNANALYSLMLMDIFDTIDNHCLPELRSLLSKDPDAVSITDEDGRTPLHIAATLANPELAKPKERCSAMSEK